MTRHTEHPLQAGGGVTYSTGLGFVPADPGPSLFGQIRRMSAVLCGLLLLDAFCQKLFALPLTYAGYLLGLNITINRSTHLVLMSDAARTVVQFLTHGAALLVTLLVFRAVFHRPLSAAHIFRRPHAGLLPIALPILAVVGVLSALSGSLLSDLLRLFGIVLDPVPGAISAWSGELLLSLGSTLLLALLRELLFRGVLLTPLRRFGDGFAVVAAALLAAVTADGLIAGVMEFWYGLAAGYFVIRSGSVRTALLGRTVTFLLLCALRAVRGMAADAELLLPLILLLVLAAATAALLRFLRRDENAFRLLPANTPHPLRYRMGAFCTGIFFLIQVGMLLHRTFADLQIIGW